MDIRLGNGFDVHAFGPGDHVMLCGVKVPHTHGLVGHSDADVAMHTVTDAIYGALASGDIGQHFPPSDPQWKGAASEIFLKHAIGRVAARGFTLTHVDSRSATWTAPSSASSQRSARTRKTCVKNWRS